MDVLKTSAISFPVHTVYQYFLFAKRFFAKLKWNGVILKRKKTFSVFLFVAASLLVLKCFYGKIYYTTLISNSLSRLSTRHSLVLFSGLVGIGSCLRSLSYSPTTFLVLCHTGQIVSGNPIFY